MHARGDFTSELVDRALRFRGVDEGVRTDVRLGDTLCRAKGLEDATAPSPNCLHHRHSEGEFQGMCIDGHAFARCLVHHVQAEHHGRFQVQQLEGQFQAVGQLRGVKHVDNDVPIASQQVVAADLFHGRAGVQGVKSRQINEIQYLPAHPRLSVGVLDGGAREV